MTLRLESPAIEDGYPIPKRYTKDGYDTSPPLSWYRAPKNTESFALLLEDLDAPGGAFCHWIVYNIPPSCTHLDEDVLRRPGLNDGSRQGVNDFGSTGYRGPCPPKSSHRYFFKLYALDTMLNLPDEARREDLLDAMNGHILDETVLTGTYRRTQEAHELEYSDH